LELRAHADGNSYGEAGIEETLLLSLLIVESGAAVKSGDCGAKSPRSDRYAARVLASLVGRAQRATILVTVQVEGFSWILSVAEDPSSLRARAKWFATCA
jgi:hypothetical protein